MCDWRRSLFGRYCVSRICRKLWLACATHNLRDRLECRSARARQVRDLSAAYRQSCRARKAGALFRKKKWWISDQLHDPERLYLRSAEPADRPSFFTDGSGHFSEVVGWHGAPRSEKSDRNFPLLALAHRCFVTRFDSVAPYRYESFRVERRETYYLFKGSPR